MVGLTRWQRQLIDFALGQFHGSPPVVTWRGAAMTLRLGKHGGSKRVEAYISNFCCFYFNLLTSSTSRISIWPMGSIGKQFVAVDLRRWTGCYDQATIRRLRDSVTARSSSFRLRASIGVSSTPSDGATA